MPCGREFRLSPHRSIAAVVKKAFAFGSNPYDYNASVRGETAADIAVLDKIVYVLVQPHNLAVGLERLNLRQYAVFLFRFAHRQGYFSVFLGNGASGQLLKVLISASASGRCELYSAANKRGLLIMPNGSCDEIRSIARITFS